MMPISYVALFIAALLAVAAIASGWMAGMQVWLTIGAACALSLFFYVMRGWQLSGIGLIGLLDLARAPLFLLWKLRLLLRKRKSSAWQRTDREQQP